jgi:autotransporter-associated beta strand protein
MMKKMSGRKPGYVGVSRFAAAALALLLAGREAEAATGLLANVPEAAGYTLVYEFPIPVASGGWYANPVPYSYTNTASIANGSFDRVAYYMELVKASGQTQWVYVSMTAFTTNATRLGIPRNYVLRHNAYDTANPSNATIRSNVSGITNADGCNTVNLEFWPSNYGGGNDYGVPGANGGTYDFGDGGALTTSGHSCMQIHNYGAGQTLFAYNAWAGTGTSNLGLGNSPTPVNGGVDWTFDTSNISTYTVRTLQILVRSLSIVNVPATNVTASSGWMNGQLAAGNPCDVYAYWGDTDRTTNSGQWAHSALLGSYGNGTFDLTRQVTGLSGGATTWYTFLASNAVEMAWAQPSLNFVTATAPAVDNGSGAAVSAGQTVLRGNLTAGGTSDIYIYWGLSDGGQSANYEHAVKLTDVRQGAFSTTVSALSGFPCYYVCCASNEAGVAWAPASASFALPAVADTASYSLGLRGSVFQPVTFAQSAVDLRGAAYSVSPSRVFTGTLPGTVLATSEVPSRNIVLSGPATTWNEFGGSPGDTFVAALSGRFFPPVSGSYTFRWSNDDRGWLFMDTNDNGVFESSEAVGNYAWDGIGSRTLTAGQGYNFIFFSQEANGGDSLAFWYTPPGGVETYVNPSAQAGQWRYASSSAPSASIANTPVSALTADAATLSGDLYGRNWGFDVYAYWGVTDGGNAAANWQTNAFVGRFQDWDGPVSLPVGGLEANQFYYYTFFISNNLMTAWAANSETFATDAVTIEAADASASEAGPDTGCFRVARPDTSTNGALTVYYTLSGTAGNGSDFETLSGSVVIPSGAVSAEFYVAPLDDTVWQEGAETVVAALASGNYLIGAASSAVVTIQDGDAPPSAWSQRMPLRFTGYNRTETLTNFPALVTLDEGLAGFSYSQFLSGANGDLRFTDGSMTRELPYEIESWDPSGQSRVWVQIPALTNNATIWMLWRRAGLTAPSYTANGATWSESYVNVAHLSESNGTVGNSALVGSPVTVSGAPVQAVPGMIGTGVQFDGLDDLISFGTIGRPFDNLTFSAWLKTSNSHERDAQSTSGTAGTAGQKYAFDVEAGGSSSTSAGLSVGTNGLSVYEHASTYMPALAVYSNMIGSGWNFVTVTYLNRQPRIYCNGSLASTGLTSPRTPVYAPYRIGGQPSYGYFTGLMDEVRVSSVPRSANWIWAEYMNAASNSVFATVGALQSGDSPLVENRPASDVASNLATLNGYLSATGGTETAVAVYWGEQDGGADAGAWANTNWFAAPAAAGAYSTDISGLTSGTAYYYRFAATNASGAVWSAASETLLTAAVTLQETDASAAEEPAETGVISVSRGAAYDAQLTVYYTLSGTGVNGVDFGVLSGSVTIPSGAASANIVVAPLFNRNYLARATDTVTLTLAAGGYISGSPDSGTVTITNWQPASGVGLDVPRNFYSSSTVPIEGSETLIKTSAGQMMVGAASNNTFKGDILVDTDGGILRVGINGSASGVGVTLPGMTAANTITVKRGGQLYIDDNGTGNSAGSIPNRFGTDGNRPSVALAGGTLTLNGANFAATVPQNLNTLSLGSGYNTVTANRNSAGTPQLVLANVTQAKGSHVNFTGTSLGATAINAPQVRFMSPPALVGGGGAAGSKTISIMPGARYTYDWVTHDGTTGIRPLTAAEYNTVAGNDVNAAGATENVKITGTTPTGFAGLAADMTVNSLNINVAANTTWTPTNKLTLTSGQLLSGVQNNSMTLNYPAKLTAGSGADASLDVSVFQSTTYIRALIEDNGSGKVTLTKNGGATLTLDGSVDNTYSGGTFVNEGPLATGGTANRRYLGPGPVRVNAAQLTLGHVGATANASGYDYTAVNGAQIGVATYAYTADDTFNIESGSVIYGGASLGLGLNSLDRGIGVAGATPTITLGSDAIVAHSTALTAPFSLGTNTIRNLGTGADLYYGLVGEQTSPAGAITLGSNTPFKGLSSDRYDRRWGAGTISVAPGTSEIWLQGMIRPGASPANLYIGNWLIDGGPVIAPYDVGPLTANVLGTVILSDSTASYGDTAAGKPVTFAVKAGSTLAVDRPDAMGTGNGLASVRVEDGGTMTTWTPGGINGSVTVQAGGRFQANNAGGLTGSGSVTFESNSILELSTALGFSGPQSDVIAASLPPGQLVRLNADPFGSPVEMLDARLGSKSPIYEVYGGDRRQANPLVTNTTVLTLNRDAATGAGGMLVNDWASRSFAAAANGVLVIGPNGGTIAATSNTTLYVTQPMALGSNALTIGATNVLDRILLPKLGTVQFNSAFGLNTALPGSSITVIPGATLNNAANTLPDETDITVEGTFLVGGTETIGSLAGAGLVNLQGNSLTVGRNNNSSTFSGLLTNTLVSTLLTKTGAGRLELTSSAHPYTGQFAVNNGILALSGNGALATPAGAAAFTLSDGGTLLLDNAAVNSRDRLAGVSSGITFQQGGTFRFVGKDGEASGETLGAALFLGGAATIDVVNGAGSGSSAEVVFDAVVPMSGTVNFTASNGTLGSAGDHPRVFFNGLGAGLLGYATVGGAPAYYDAGTGVRAYTLGEGTEFDGTSDQSDLDTTYTALNNHLALTAARSVNSLWIDSPGAGFSVNLGSSGANSLTLASGRLSLTGDHDFSLTRSGSSSGTLTRSANGTLFLGVGAGRTLTASVPIANGAGLVEKDGAGTLVLSAGNTFTGALNVNEGAVRYAAGGSGDLAGNAVNILNAGVLDYAGDTDTLGALTVYSGGVTNSAATGILTASALTLGGGPAGSSAYVNTGAGTGSFKLGGNVTFSALNDPDKATLAGKLDLNGATRTFTVNNSYAAGAEVDLDIPAVISGAAGNGVTKAGGGVLRLSGTNTFNGNVYSADNCGTIIASHPQALGTPSFGRIINVNNNDTMVLDGANGDIAVPANYTNLFLNGAGDSLIGPIRGALTSLSGSNSVACPITLTGNNVYLASRAGKLTLAGNINGVLDLTVNGNGDMELGGAVATGAKVLVKNGTGTLTLSGSGANTFSGTTTLNAGTLVLAKSNGVSAVNAIAGGAVTVNNGAVLRYAASSTNPDLVGTGAITLNGNGLLDFNGASDTLGAVAVAASGATGETTNLLNTAGGGNLTVASLTVTPAPSLLTRMDTRTGTLTLGGNVTFNASALGRALLSGKLALGGSTRTLTINTGIHTNDDMAIDAVISGGAGVGVTKAGGGILRLDGANTFDGVLSLAGSVGSVILGNPRALGTPSATRTAAVGSGSTLALDGVGIYDPNNRIALNLNGTGNTRHGAVSGALVNLTGSNTVPCAIALAGNTQIASKQAGGKLTLTGAFSGAYTLTVAGPGETALAGTSGAIPSATAITVSSNGVLTLENTALTNNANRIGTMPVTLAGGTFRFSHDGGAANYSEACGALLIGLGSNTVYASQAAGGQTSALTFSSIACAGGTVNFVGEGLGENGQNRIFISGQADGLIGPWATINGTSLAMYSSTRGVYAGAGTEVGVAALGGTAASVIPHDASASAVINTMGSEGPITLEALWTNQILEVRQETQYASVVAMTNDIAGKALQTSRLLIKAGQESLTIGEAEDVGALMALSSGGVLSLENQNASETLTVNAAIPNNNAASGLSKFGLGPVLLTGSNSYSGATLINEGILEFNSSSAQRLDGVISGAGTLVKSGTNQLHLFGANTFTGPLYVNAGLVRPDKNTAFGTTASGTYIASGATLDVGCDKSVGGTRLNDNLNLGAEEFTVSGSGIDGLGVIVNNGASNQMSAVQRVLLSGDATFGGIKRWDVRSGYLFLNDHTLMKTGVNEVAIIGVPIYPGSGHLVVNQGLLRLETSLLMNGSAANTATVNRGATLELYNLLPYVPAWSLILNDGAFFRGAGTVYTTNYNVWAGPVTLNGTAFMNGAQDRLNWTLSGDVSGVGTLVKAGSSGSTLWLTSTNNTYSGGTIVSNANLYAKHPGSLPGYNDGRLTVAGGGTLVVHASDGSLGFTAENIRDLNGASAFVANNAYLGIDTSLANLVCPYDLPRRMGVSKLGTNTLTLSGNAVLGNAVVYDGTLNLSGNNIVSGTLAVASGRANLTLTNAFVGTAEIYAGNSSQTNGVLTLGPDASLTCGGNFRIGLGNSSAALYLDGGSISNAQAAGDANFAFGRETNSYGYFRMTAGSVWARRLQTGGYGDNISRGRGLLRISGGSLTFSEHVLLGRNVGCESVLTLDGGTITHTNGNELSLARQGGRSELNLCGGTFSNANMYTIFQPTAGYGPGTGIVNLCAGSLITAPLQNPNNAPAYLNFCGGTLAPSGDSTVFVPGNMAGVYSFGAFGAFAGGAVIDSNGKNVTIPAVIRNPTGLGVSDVSLANPGLGYIGEPYVSIEGGSGTGATAVANLVDDGTGRGTFSVGSVTITCPGVGYDTTPTVLFKGGGFNIVAAQVGTVTLAPNTSGGLTKLGAGILTLSGANTYTGATTLVEGTLKLGIAGALMPNSPIILAGGTLDLNGFTVTNAISGVGLVSNGTVVTDFSPAGAGVIGTNSYAFTGATVKGTYLADVTSDGDSDLLDIQGNIDLSTLDLRLVDPDALVRGKVYTILSCSGTRTGVFKSTNLPDSRWHVVYRADGSVQLLFANGTVIRVR